MKMNQKRYQLFRQRVMDVMHHVKNATITELMDFVSVEDNPYNTASWLHHALIDLLQRRELVYDGMSSDDQMIYALPETDTAANRLYNGPII